MSSSAHPYVSSAARAKRKARRVVLSSWGWSQQGDRQEENQDAFLNWPQRQCWAVADGVGSSRYGAAASRWIISSLMELPEVNSLEGQLSCVRGCLEKANSELASGEIFSGSASSTVVVLLIQDGQAACLWAGDSRCYLLRDGILYLCTRDHTLRQEKIDKGELTIPEAQRMIKGNIITNAVGGCYPLKLDQVQFPLQAGDRFLLCSDGLTNILSADMLMKMLGQESARVAADNIQRVLKSYSQPDNITLVTVFLSQEIEYGVG